MAVQPDGKILVGGSFTMLGGGGTGTTPRNRIGRLNADGSLDTSFNPGANGVGLAVAVQPDGKILVGGYFTMLGGGGTGTTPRNRIGRLNADGSLDTHFNPGRELTVSSPLAVQPDGKILVGGDFTCWAARTGTTRATASAGSTPMARSTPASIPARTTVYAVAVQPDGKILVGGDFTTLGGGGTGTTPRNYLGRLNPDGSLDTSFNPGANSTSSTRWPCSRMGRSWSAVISRCSAAAPARRRATDRPAQCRRLARQQLQSRRERVVEHPTNRTVTVGRAASFIGGGMWMRTRIRWQAATNSRKHVGQRRRDLDFMNSRRH